VVVGPPCEDPRTIFTRLFAEHEGLIRSILRSEQNILQESKKDMMQRVAEKIFSYVAENKRAPDHEERFIRATVRHEVWNHLKKPNLVRGLDLDAEIAASGPDPEAARIVAERLEQLNAALAELSDVEREVFESVEIDEQSIDEAARALDRHRGTVSTQLTRARNKVEALMNRSKLR
jgi:RNA polymerase sigma factor (sigma-70 family)